MYHMFKPIITDGQRAHPASHLRDCNRTSGSRRRPHSAGIHFKDTRGTDENVRKGPKTDHISISALVTVM